MPFKRCFFLLVVSAILLVGSVLNPAAGWLVWIALVPFLVVLRSVGRTAGLLAGFGVGLIYFGTLFYWIALYEVRILVLTLVLSSLFFVVFSLLIIVAWEFAGRAWYAVFIPPAAWLAATFLFSLTPLPDLGSQLAISQAPVFPLITKLFGVSGMTFVVILANTLLAEWLYWERTQYAFGALILILFLFPGKQLAALPTGGPTLRVALVQHNFPIDGAWRFGRKEQVLAFYEQAVKRHAGENDLVIFPQYGLPIDAKRKGDLFKRLVRETNTAVLLGTYIPVTEGASLTESKRTNSALLFTPDGRLQEYKAVLAPPFRQIGQVMGTKFQLLKLGNVRLGVLLCYEDVNPRHTRALVRQGADLLVALSNPGHFTKTHLPRFHLLHDQARAIENGKTLLRVSPNGISAVIDLNGRVTHETKLDQEAVLTAEITTVFSG